MAALAKAGGSALFFGLAASLPVFIGALSSSVIPRLVGQERLKAALLCCVALQPLGLALILLGLMGYLPKQFAVLVGLSLYWTGGMSSAPLWIDWMSQWIHRFKVTQFHSRRNSFVTFISLLAFSASSLLFLKWSDEGFVTKLLLIIAIGARVVSWLLLFVQTSPPPRRAYSSEADSQVFPSKIPAYLFGFFILIVLFKASTGVASPYFIPFKLNELKIEMSLYVWLTALSFLGRSLILHQIGHFKTIFSPFVGMLFSMLGISIVSSLYLFSSSSYWLAAVEIFGGVSWGLFEISLLAILLKELGNRSRKVNSLLAAVMALAVVGGASVGALIIDHSEGYASVLISSSVLRFVIFVAVAFYCSRHPQLRRSAFEYRQFLSSVLSLRPSFSLVGRIIPILDREKKTRMPTK